MLVSSVGQRGEEAVGAERVPGELGELLEQLQACAGSVRISDEIVFSAL